MKTTLLSVLLLLTSMLAAQTIDHPHFKVRTGSVNTITKIERTPENTKLHIHAIFRPQWWIKIDKTDYLEDVATGKKYPIVGSEGIELTKETFLPASGEMDFVLLFAPLPKETKEIHWLAPDDSEGSTYNISLEKAKKKEQNPLDAIKGNWLTADTYNEWGFGFYDSLAIMENQFYQYEAIRKRGKDLLLTLKDDKENRIDLLLSPQKDGNCLIRQGKGEKRLFSRKPQVVSVQQPETDFSPFFRTDTVRLQGYLDGYDPRLGFETGLIYLSNEATREDYPTVITIHPDGRFESKFIINHPVENRLIFGNNSIPFYAEPGQTLTVYLSWEDIMARSRSRNRTYPMKNTRYMGPSAITSQAMNFCASLLVADYAKLQADQKKLSPNQFKTQQTPTLQRWNHLADSLIQANKYSKKTTHLIRNKVKLLTGTLFFDFLMGRDYYAKEDTTNQVLKIQETEDYYDFLRDMPLNDETTMAADEFSTFINRFEYMPIKNASWIAPKSDSLFKVYPQVSLLTFFKEKKIKLTPDEEKVRKTDEEYAGKTVTSKADEIMDQEKTIQAAAKREPELTEEYNRLYPAATSPTLGMPQIEKEKSWVHSREKMSDARKQVLAKMIGNSMPFAWEIAIVRRLRFDLSNIKIKKIASDYLNRFKEEVSHPYLLAETERIFDKIHPEKRADSYELPANRAADIFRKIIQPHQGKVLFVDFWATTCGPCRGGIEDTAPLREKYKNHPDFQFVYITSEKESPTSAYNKYVDKNLKGEACYRVSETEFNFLRELFQFNGIPHYRLIEKEGSVSNEKLSTYNLAPYLEKRFETKE